MSFPEILHTVHVFSPNCQATCIETVLEMLELNYSQWEDKISSGENRSGERFYINAPSKTVSSERFDSPRKTVSSERFDSPRKTVSPERFLSPRKTASPERFLSPRKTVSPERFLSYIRFDIFLNSAPEAKETAHNIKDQLTKTCKNENWSIYIDEIPNKNWQDAWKEFFHVERVSEHIVIKPSHEDYTIEPTDCVINIDPGMSFGTGQHETTKACLKFLDKLSNINLNSEKCGGEIASRLPTCSVCSMSQTHEPTQKQSFLDLGCGSGILSIAAAKLGFSPIKALDIDPDSVIISTENFEENSVQNDIDVTIGDVSKLELNQTFDVVVANILAPILLANAKNIAETVNKSGGHLVLAGILNEQYQEIHTAYTTLGFKEIESITENEWTSGCFINLEDQYERRMF